MFDQLRQQLQRQLWNRSTVRRQRRKLPTSVPAWSESLEDRTLLSAIWVTTADDVVADDGLVSLREAIEAANTDTSVDGSAAGDGKDVIQFDASLLHSTITLSGEQLVLSDDVTIIGLGQDQLTIDGNGQSRIFEIDWNKDVEISDLTLTNGFAKGDVVSESSGGAIYNRGYLVLENVTVSENRAAENGGGIHNFREVTIVNSTISGNASEVQGGGIYNAGGSSIVTNSTISANTSGGPGGGIYNRAHLEIIDSTITGNAAENSGGGVYQHSGSLRLLQSTISNNTSQESGGGLCDSSGSLFMDGSTISGNAAKFSGGGMYLGTHWLSQTLDIVANSTISGNISAHDGGGIYAASSLQMANTTISGNEAGRRGGGIYGSEIVLDHVTITDNLANTGEFGYGDGGAIWNSGGPVTAFNSIISGNHRRFNNSEVADDFAGYSSLAVASSHNLIGTGGETLEGVNGNIVGVIDPRLAPLADNGGPTLTHALLPDSFAVDAANPDDGVVYDQLGLPRQIDGNGDGVARNDIGAVERVPGSILQVDELSDIDDGDYSAGHLSLREAIKLANEDPGAQEIFFASNLVGDTIVLSSGEFVLTDDVVIVGLGQSDLTIDSGGASRIFTVQQGVTATLARMTLMNSRAEEETASVHFGGAIYNLGDLTVVAATLQGHTALMGGAIAQLYGTLTVIDSTLTENSATQANGGAIYCSIGSVTLRNSTISENSATDYGGGVYTQFADVQIESTTFFHNNASSSGGGLYASSYQSLTIDSSTFERNNSGNGGGIYLSGATADASATIGNSKIVHNGALVRTGGVELSHGRLVVAHSEFVDNFVVSTVHGSGAGLNILPGSTSADISYSLFAGNSGKTGAGIANSGVMTIFASTISENRTTSNGAGIYNGGTLTVDSSTIAYNIAQGGGGGIYNSTENGGATLLLKTSTVSGNISGTGAGIFNRGHLTIEGSTITRNHTPLAENRDPLSFAAGLQDESLDTYVSETIISGNYNYSNGQELPSDILGALDPSSCYNLVGTGGGLVDGVNGNIVGVTNPYLSVLRDNGGPTMTHQVYPHSLALDAGMTSVDESYDQRGVQRDLFHDIGAYEMADGPRVDMSVRTSFNNQFLTLHFTGRQQSERFRIELGETIVISVGDRVWELTPEMLGMSPENRTYLEAIEFDGGPGTNSVEIVGTPGDDVIDFSTEGGYFYAPGWSFFELQLSQFSKFFVEGGGGEDIIGIKDPDGIDRYTIDQTGGQIERPGDVILPNRLIEFRDFASIRVAPGEDDTVLLYDSAGDDHLVTSRNEGWGRPFTLIPEHPGFAYAGVTSTVHVGAKLQGPGFENIVYGHTNVTVVSKRGGHDTAELGDNSLFKRSFSLDSESDLEFVPISTSSIFYSQAPIDSNIVILPGNTRVVQDHASYTVLGFGRITVDAAGGDDSIHLYGTDMDDQFAFQDEVATLRCLANGYSVTINNAETIDVYSQGGNDKAFLYDTEGDDTFVSTANDARMFAADGSKTIVHGFGTVYAFAENGGNDTALFYDSAGNDTFVANPGFVRMESPSADVSRNVHSARGFAKAIGYANNGGYDTAYFHDSAGNDTYVASPNKARMEGDGFHNSAFGFEQNLGFALNGGVDNAYLHDSAGDDTFVAHPTHVRMTGDGFYNSAQNFETATGFAMNGGQDTATLHDSAADDHYIVRPEQITMMGGGYRNNARDFESTTGLALHGGIDNATFYDTAGDDEFITSPTVARMNTGGIAREAKYFENVVAHAVNGGNDNASLYGSAASDFFHSYRDRSTFYGSGSMVTAYGFDQVIGFGQGGTDFAFFHQVGDDDYVLGRDQFLRLARTNGMVSRVNGFDTTNDQILLDVALGQEPFFDVNYKSIDYNFETLQLFVDD